MLTHPVNQDQGGMSVSAAKESGCKRSISDMIKRIKTVSQSSTSRERSVCVRSVSGSWGCSLVTASHALAPTERDSNYYKVVCGLALPMWYNSDMAPKITDEMRAAIAQQPGRPVEVEDELTRKVYVLIDADAGRAMTQQWIREQLQIGLDAASRGDIEPFDADAIKAMGRDQLDRAR
jgi:hypothetical protein